MPRKARGRELIDTGTDKRSVRRDDQGQFKESDDVCRSAGGTSGNTPRPRPAPARGPWGQGALLRAVPSP
jgi:hypothetical protein